LRLVDAIVITQPYYKLFVKVAKWEANYGKDMFWGPWPKCPPATPMVL